MEFIKLSKDDINEITQMSEMATEIVRDHFDPIIGEAQNTYMIDKFQTVASITDQLEHGYQYFFVCKQNKRVGFLAFYPRENAMYLSKFYLYKNERQKGYSKKMLDFVIDHTRKAGLPSIELNVNRNNSACLAYDHLGFKVIRTEKNDIGCGYSMDDYVYSYSISIC